MVRENDKRKSYLNTFMGYLFNKTGNMLTNIYLNYFTSIATSQEKKKKATARNLTLKYLWKSFVVFKETLGLGKGNEGEIERGLSVCDLFNLYSLSVL
jgi:hypothetical protein